MSDTVKKMAQDVQQRIQELAYLMWESAGKQHGMATEYWLRAEQEVLKTVQAAAERMVPGAVKKDEKPAPKTAKTPAAKPVAKPAAKPAAAQPPKPAAAPAAKRAASAAKPPTLKANAAPPTGSQIEEIEGIGPAFAKKLSAAGVSTRAELLDRCGGAKGRKEIAGRTKIPEKRILRWVNVADLMRIKGVDGNMVELMEAAGVDTVTELRTRRADSLTAKMAEINKQKKLARSAPSEKQVSGWLEAARTLEPMVTH